MRVPPKSPPRHHWRIAHRGASAYEPENTLRAFRRALELGADGIELDVHLSQDGHPVVIHDASVEKTTDGKGLVAEMSLEELRRLDAGKGERIPTLEEVLHEFGGHCLLLIELKGEGTPQAVVETVRRHRLENWVILSSFDPTKVAAVKEIAPELETSVLTGSWEVDFVALAEEARADCIQFGWERHPAPHTLLTPELFQRAQEAGLRVLCWHEERPHVIAALSRMPVYGICSDRPDLLVKD
ncbi:MAG: glycerophosphoryl diester phosphodiesterase [Candidatus Poribacteria bacterium]|nr:MAG: glycerophosphoryl diester phosphodiesterase [Candidatus Poribacteria bacterium]